MKHLTMLLSGLVLTTGTVYGDEEPGPNYEHLKPLEWMIGVWVVELEAPQAIPGVVQKGDSIKMTATVKWGLDKNVIRLQAISFLNGKQGRIGEGTVGWDAEKKHIVEYGFDSFGGRSTVVTTVVDKNTFKGRAREVAPDGTVREFTNNMKVIDQDTIESTLTDITEAGVKKPDNPTVIARRKK